MANDKKLKQEIRKMIEGEGVEVLGIKSGRRHVHLRFLCRYMGKEFTLLTSSSPSDKVRALLNQRTNVRRYKKEIEDAKSDLPLL